MLTGGRLSANWLGAVAALGTEAAAAAFRRCSSASANCLAAATWMAAVVGGSPRTSLLLTFAAASDAGAPRQRLRSALGMRRAYEPHLLHQFTPELKARSCEWCACSAIEPRHGRRANTFNPPLVQQESPHLTHLLPPPLRGSVRCPPMAAAGPGSWIFVVSLFTFVRVVLGKPTESPRRHKGQVLKHALSEGISLLFVSQPDIVQSFISNKAVASLIGGTVTPPIEHSIPSRLLGGGPAAVRLGLRKGNGVPFVAKNRGNLPPQVRVDVL